MASDVCTRENENGVEPPRDATPSRMQRLADAVTALCACDSEQEVVEVVRRSARALCGAAGIAIVWREEDRCHYVAEDSAVPLWTGQSFAADSCISGWAMNNGFQAAIEDIYQDARVPHDAYRPTGIRSLVMTPVGEPPAAALGAYWLEVRRHPPEDLAVLKALSECMASALRTLALRSSVEQRLAESETRRREREAARSEAAFQSHLLDVVEQAVIASDPQGRVIYWNAYAEKLYGWKKEEALGRTVIELKAAPEASDKAEALMAELQAGKSWAGELILRRKDGTTFPAYVHDWPVTSPSGELIAIVGVSVNNTERRKAEEHQQLLINELNHRVKNTLAIVQSIAAQSLKADTPPLAAREVFQARLHALAEAHGLMIQVGWQPVPLLSILQTALQPFGYGSSGSQIELDGPLLVVSPRTAVSLALAVHELGTNAVKHGALALPTGRVLLQWGVEPSAEGEQFHLRWAERGGPAVAAPGVRGFGSRLIERGLARELGGKALLEFRPEGLVCTIRAPTSTALAGDAEPSAMFPLP